MSLWLQHLVKTLIVFFSFLKDKYKQAKDGNFYSFHTTEKNWTDARSMCKQERKGARLAIIDNEISFQAMNDLEFINLDIGQW